MGDIKLTNAGIQLLNKVQAGIKLEFTKFAVGDGEIGNNYIPSLTALIKQLYTYPVNRLVIQSANTISVGFGLNNENVKSGFYFREVGLFARDPDLGEILYAYQNFGTGAGYIEAGGGNTILEEQFNILSTVGDSSITTAIMDKSIIYVTYEELENTLKASKKYTDDKVSSIKDASTTQKGVVQLTNSTDSTSETVAPTAKALKTVSDAAFPKTGGTITGDVNVSGGSVKVTGGIRANGAVNLTAGMFVGSGNNEATTQMTLAIGEKSTGLNHNGGSHVDFRSGGVTAAYMKDGRFVVRGNADDYYDVARDIIDLKQSGVDRKNELVAVLNAKNVAANSREAFSTLVSKVNNIVPVTKSSYVGNVLNDASGQYQGDDLQRHFQWTPQGNATRDYVFQLGEFPYQVGYGALSITNVQVVINGSQGISNFPSGWVDNFNRLQTSNTAAVYFDVVGYGKGTITLRVTFNASRATDIRFSCSLYRASGI